MLDRKKISQVIFYIFYLISYIYNYKKIAQFLWWQSKRIFVLGWIHRILILTLIKLAKDFKHFLGKPEVKLVSPRSRRRLFGLQQQMAEDHDYVNVSDIVLLTWSPPTRNKTKIIKYDIYMFDLRQQVTFFKNFMYWANGQKICFGL